MFFKKEDVIDLDEKQDTVNRRPTNLFTAF